MTATAVTASPF